MSELNDNLEQATADGDIDAIQELIDQGADLNARISGSDGNSLFNPCENGDADAIALLLDSGANIEFKDESGMTPLLAALRAENAEPAGAKKAVSLLIERGADVKHVDDYGKNALMHAAEGGILKNVKALVDLGLDPEVESPDGETAESLAQGWIDEGAEYKEIIEYLNSL